MHTVFRKAAGAVEEFFLCRGKDLKSNVISRVTLEGTDTNVWYEKLYLPHTAHAVHRVR